MPSWEMINNAAKKVRESLSLRTYPLGVKFFKDLNEAEKIITDAGARRPLKNFNIRMALCQAINTSRTYGWVLSVSLEDMWCIYGALAMGLLDEVPEYLMTETLKWHVKDDHAEKALREILEKRFLPLKSVNVLVIPP